ncbi:MAG: MBL fold metallo-hydrolase [Candidatus Bathyarchaeia archaeon]
MKITLLGTGAIMPTAKRSFSGILVETRTESLLLDPGPGSLSKLAKIGINILGLDRVFITHFHLDHCADFLPLLMAKAFEPQENPRGVWIYGPPGLEELAQDLFSRTERFRYMSSAFRFFDYTRLKEVGDGPVDSVPEWTASCTPVMHFDGVAYKIEAEGRSLVFSGDTIPDDRLVRLAKGVDLLIHDCSFPDGELIGLHTTDVQLAEVAQEAHPKKLVANHLYPTWEGKEHKLVAEIRKKFDNELLVGQDFMTIEI